MNDAVIVAACRTPIGKLQGTLASVPAPQLGAIAIRSALERSRVGAGMVDEVIMGNVLSAGVGQAPARQAALRSGLPSSVSALTINKVCGSGLQAIMLAAQAIRAGDAQVVVAGGLESMSRAPFLVDRTGPAVGDRILIDSMTHEGLTCAFSEKSMGQIAEALATSAGISRDDQDRFAFESHCKALRAIESGAFRSELVPVTISNRSGEKIVDRDEGPRADTTRDRLQALAPAFQPGGSVTAGNASMISDGAAAVIVTSRQFQQEHRLEPIARIVSYATAGLEPDDLFVAPVPAIRTAIARAGISINDVDLFDINEAFAVQVLACVRELGLSEERVNVHGGAIALGHPLGCSGARVAVTLMHAMRQRQVRYGVAALCLGGGNAVATVFESVG